MADIVRSGTLNGTIRAAGALSGGMSGRSAPAGRIAAAAEADVEVYDGDYDVTPQLDSEVVLATGRKKMKSDVTVKKIPQYEVSNEAGGTTLILGGN